MDESSVQMLREDRTEGFASLTQIHSEPVKKSVQEFQDEQLQVALDLEWYKCERLLEETTFEALADANNIASRESTPELMVTRDNEELITNERRGQDKEQELEQEQEPAKEQEKELEQAHGREPEQEQERELEKGKESKEEGIQNTEEAPQRDEQVVPTGGYTTKFHKGNQ